MAQSSWRLEVSEKLNSRLTCIKEFSLKFKTKLFRVESLRSSTLKRNVQKQNLKEEKNMDMTIITFD